MAVDPRAVRADALADRDGSRCRERRLRRPAAIERRDGPVGRGPTIVDRDGRGHPGRPHGPEPAVRVMAKRPAAASAPTRRSAMTGPDPAILPARSRHRGTGASAPSCWRWPLGRAWSPGRRRRPTRRRISETGGSARDRRARTRERLRERDGREAQRGRRGRPRTRLRPERQLRGRLCHRSVPP